MDKVICIKLKKPGAAVHKNIQMLMKIVTMKMLGLSGDNANRQVTTWLASLEGAVITLTAWENYGAAKWKTVFHSLFFMSVNTYFKLCMHIDAINRRFFPIRLHKIYSIFKQGYWVTLLSFCF